MNGSDMLEIVKTCVIVNMGLGSKVLHKAMHHGVRGGTILLGTGTMCNRLLECLGLSTAAKRSSTWAPSARPPARCARSGTRNLNLKANHGIAFTTAVATVVGTHGKATSEHSEERGANKAMYHAITIIVDGAGGGRHRRGGQGGFQGRHDSQGARLGHPRNPATLLHRHRAEKEIVLILSERSRPTPSSSPSEKSFRSTSRARASCS